jgi:hypothetical protein
MPAAIQESGKAHSATPAVSSAGIRLLYLCARVDMTSEEARRFEELARGPVDWEIAVKLARRHRCLPLLHRHLKSICPDALPAELASRVRQECQQLALHNLILTSDLLQIVNRFDQAGIESIPYKGPLLAHLAYGDLSLRGFGDLDILVRQPDLQRAQRELVELGYTPYKHNELSSFFVENSCHYLFAHPRHQFYVELHWAVAPSYFPLAFRDRRLWQHLQRIPFGGMSLLAHKFEDLVLALCIHGGKHHWSRLSWIVDLAELIRRHPELDWDWLLAEAARLHCLRLVFLGLHLVVDLLQAPVPAQVRERISRDQTVRQLADEIQEGLAHPVEISWSGLKNVSYMCRMRERLRDRVAYFVRRTITPTEFELDWKSLPRPLHFLYFPLRALRMALQYGGALTRRMVGRR